MQKLDDLQPPADTPQQRSNWLGILLVALVGFASYLVLSFLTLNFIGPVLLVGGVLLLVVMLHYVVWGWWLGRVIRQSEDDDEETQRG